MTEDPQERAEHRQRERQERQAEVLREFESVVEDVKFPSNSAELQAEYRTDPDEVVAEEESLGSVLDRLDDEYETEAAEVQREYENVVEDVDDGDSDPA